MHLNAKKTVMQVLGTVSMILIALLLGVYVLRVITAQGFDFFA